MIYFLRLRYFSYNTSPIYNFFVWIKWYKYLVYIIKIQMPSLHWTFTIDSKTLQKKESYARRLLCRRNDVGQCVTKCVITHTCAHWCSCFCGESVGRECVCSYRTNTLDTWINVDLWWERLCEYFRDFQEMIRRTLSLIKD